MEEYYGNTSDAAIELFVSLAVIAGLGWGLLMIFYTLFSKSERRIRREIRANKKRQKEYEEQKKSEEG